MRRLTLTGIAMAMLTMSPVEVQAQDPWPTPNVAGYDAVGRLMPLDGSVEWAISQGFVETEGSEGVSWTGQLATDAALTFTAEGNVVTRSTILVSGEAPEAAYLREWLAFTGGTSAPADFGAVVQQATVSGADTRRTILLADRTLEYSALPALRVMGGSMTLAERVDQRPDLGGVAVPNYAAAGEPPYFLGSPPTANGPVKQVAHTDLFRLEGGAHAFVVFASGGPYECEGNMNLAGNGEWYPIAKWQVAPGKEFTASSSLELTTGTYAIAIVSTCFWRVGIDGG